MFTDLTLEEMDMVKMAAAKALELQHEIHFDVNRDHAMRLLTDLMEMSSKRLGEFDHIDVQVMADMENYQFDITMEELHDLYIIGKSYAFQAVINYIEGNIGVATFNLVKHMFTTVYPPTYYHEDVRKMWSGNHPFTIRGMAPSLSEIGIELKKNLMSVLYSGNFYILFQKVVIHRRYCLGQYNGVYLLLEEI